LTNGSESLWTQCVGPGPARQGQAIAKLLTATCRARPQRSLALPSFAAASISGQRRRSTRQGSPAEQVLQPTELQPRGRPA